MNAISAEGLVKVYKSRKSEVRALDALLHRRAAGAGVGVDDRELDLVLGRVEVEEQLVDLIDHLGDAAVGPVDLVHDQDHRQPCAQRLAQYEPRLRQRALRRVDEEQHAVDHGQAALDLAPEVGVTGRVDDVDLRAVVPAGGVLGQDRDAPLALEAGIHHAVDRLRMGCKRARLLQQGVHERCLAVVDVGDDREVANVIAEPVGMGTHR